MERRLDLLLPVGISFYTFQALSYIIDVYREEIRAEKNFFRYALYVSFFPQLVAGPIERSGNLLPQIQNIKNISVWDIKRIQEGLLLMVWGFFQKLVIADRASLLVENVFPNYLSYGFVEIFIATILFAFQIYCDFGGYTNIARGAAKIMGFHLMDNFYQPYLATNIRDFWRRWHISLTSWFTDYVYKPLGGSRKGKLRGYMNILIVFFISGLWHGASWHFVAWGLLHAVYQIFGYIKRSLLGRLSIHITNRFSTKVRQIVCTFLLVDAAWIFFAADSLHHATGIIHQMFCTSFSTSGIYELGLDEGNWKVLLIALFLLAGTDILHEKKISVIQKVNMQAFWFRWLFGIGFIWTVIMLGIYGVSYDASEFIYFQF